MNDSLYSLYRNMPSGPMENRRVESECSDKEWRRSKVRDGVKNKLKKKKNKQDRKGKHENRSAAGPVLEYYAMDEGKDRTNNGSYSRMFNLPKISDGPSMAQEFADVIEARISQGDKNVKSVRDVSTGGGEGGVGGNVLYLRTCSYEEEEGDVDDNASRLEDCFLANAFKTIGDGPDREGGEKDGDIFSKQYHKIGKKLQRSKNTIYGKRGGRIINTETKDRVIEMDRKETKLIKKEQIVKEMFAHRGMRNSDNNNGGWNYGIRSGCELGEKGKNLGPSSLAGGNPKTFSIPSHMFLMPTRLVRSTPSVKTYSDNFSQYMKRNSGNTRLKLLRKKIMVFPHIVLIALLVGLFVSLLLFCMFMNRAVSVGYTAFEPTLADGREFLITQNTLTFKTITEMKVKNNNYFPIEVIGIEQKVFTPFSLKHNKLP
ncbi:hypothetical protein AYI68_g330 [Smittium mucronatum]|uniref:Uncharacterized protein n=1 Tax=Smittium mucronatum TaxID=133383 RepID=A0A1R0H8I9_9FUNG|nr:hypothetical protein AYI68_g330 [Smittium mucronatum]